jgi:hypothetical protein
MPAKDSRGEEGSSLVARVDEEPPGKASSEEGKSNTISSSPGKTKTETEQSFPSPYHPHQELQLY